MKIRFLGLLIVALGPNIAHCAQSNTAIPVFVASQCNNDMVGQRLTFKTKESIRSSSSMEVTDSYAGSVIQLSLVCLDPDEDERGSISRYSYAITFINSGGFFDYLLSHGVGTCGAQRVDECAEAIVADMDSALDGLRSHIRDGSFKIAAPPAK